MRRPRSSVDRRERAASFGDSAAGAASLAASGRHQEAVDAATSALGGASAARQVELLDLRAESWGALGDMTAAEEDAQAMLALARSSRRPALLARALTRIATIEFRSGRARDAANTADDALAAARRAKDPALEAAALFTLGEAQFRLRDLERGARSCVAAARIFKSLGMTQQYGRAMWGVSATRSHQGRGAEADRAAREALAVARRCGDTYGAGNALNMLTFHETDIAKRKSTLSQALAAFEARVPRPPRHGHPQPGAALLRARALPRARRLLAQAGDLYMRTGAKGGLAITQYMLGGPPALPATCLRRASISKARCGSGRQPGRRSRRSSSASGGRPR